MSTSPTTTRPPIQTIPIPQEIIEEIETFEDEVTRLQSGDTPMDIFKPFRLQYGIYGQRQPDVQMIRIRVPFGGMNANQLRQVAEIHGYLCHGRWPRDDSARFSIALCASSSSRHHHEEISRSGLDDTGSLRQYRAKCHRLCARWRLPGRSLRCHALFQGRGGSFVAKSSESKSATEI